MPVLESQAALTLDRILLATDFKSCSDPAQEFAGALALHFHSRLTVAHVIDLSVATRSEEAVVGLPLEEMRHGTAENMEHTLEDMRQQGIKVQGQTLEAHNPAQAVVGLAKQMEASILVQGTNARTGLSKAILGSFAEGVIRHAPCPVVTIGPKARLDLSTAFAFRTILFATDLRHGATEKAATALAFAQESIAKVVMYHVVEHPGPDLPETLDTQFRMEYLLERLIPGSVLEWCAPEFLTDFGDISAGILRNARNSNADLIVLGAKRSTTWFTHVFPGVVGRVIAEAPCPVMTLASQ